MKTTELIVVGAAVLGGIVAWRSLARESSTDAPPPPGPPAGNFIYDAANDLLRATTGEQDATLGTWIYDLLNSGGGDSLAPQLADMRPR